MKSKTLPERRVIDGIEVLVDKEVRDWKSRVRHPYYQMRGKRLTRAQAFDIIRRTDMYFELYTEFDEVIGSEHFHMWWFDWTEDDAPCGWVHPTGVVGIHHMLAGVPDTERIIEEWAAYLKHFPYLDLVAGITGWEEISPEHEEYYDENFGKEDYRDEAYYAVSHSFCDNVEIGIWVHDGMLEVLSPGRAAEKYREIQPHGKLKRHTRPETPDTKEEII